MDTFYHFITLFIYKSQTYRSSGTFIIDGIQFDTIQ